VQRAPPLLAELEKLVGKEYVLFERTRGAYVEALLMTGQATQAAQQFEGMLDAVQRLQGAESELSASALVLAAGVSDRQRNAAAAEKALISAATISRKVYGANSPLTITPDLMLGRRYVQAGDPRRAEPYLRSVFANLTRVQSERLDEYIMSSAWY